VSKHYGYCPLCDNYVCIEESLVNLKPDDNSMPTFTCSDCAPYIQQNWDKIPATAAVPGNRVDITSFLRTMVHNQRRPGLDPTLRDDIKWGGQGC
jgi:hypothetical protein